MKRLLIYSIILSGLVSCHFNKKEITQAEFDRLLTHDSISDIRVTTNGEAEIKIKPFHKNDEIFILPIESSESFKISLNELQMKLAAQNIHPKYQSCMSSGPDPIYFLLTYLIISFSIIILFLFSVISVLKNRFESATDKLIWFLVVLIPMIGPILYVFIGRKQKLKKE